MKLPTNDDIFYTMQSAIKAIRADGEKTLIVLNESIYHRGRRLKATFRLMEGISQVRDKYVAEEEKEQRKDTCTVQQAGAGGSVTQNTFVKPSLDADAQLLAVRLKSTKICSFKLQKLILSQ